MRTSLVTLLHFGALYISFTAAGPHHPHPRCEIPSLIDATAEELQKGLSKGCFTSVDLVNAYVARSNDVNATVRAVTEFNPDVIKIAKQMDRERKAGRSRGPLHGLPILLKNNIATLDKMTSTAGSYALLGARPPTDATIVSKLRNAGVIILGKVGASQWANFRSMNGTSGWSAYGDQVKGAYWVDQDPSGSSSGSGVASDLGLAFAAIGTETSGSIVVPSEKNNVVGIKPTVGLTSRHMVVPISEHQDTIGPMARTVKDAAFILEAIAGVDKYDNYTSAIPFKRIPQYSKACKAGALRGKRIGVPRNVINFYRIPEHVVKAFNASLATMEKAGAVIVENTDFTGFEEYSQSSDPWNALFADFLSNIATFLSKLSVNPNNLKNLEDVRKFTQNHPLEAYPNRDTGVWDMSIEQGIHNTDPAFWPKYQKILYFGGEGGVLGALKRHKLDAIVLPTEYAYEIPGLVGAPLITVPMSSWPEGTPVIREPRGELVVRNPNLPIGISFLGDLWSEEKLIGIAYAYEQKTKVRPTIKRYITPKSQLKDVM
ncbi:hypothetical protein FQN57_004041 [Myotisia sp. PD_48]|nr:hypothetical protein FQN57_004041 [Myotisia sp. PD_48]